MTQKINISNISRPALSFFLPFGLMGIWGLITQRTLPVLLILITGNLLGALWADRFGFKSLMVWSVGIALGVIFFITQLNPPSSLRFFLEHNSDHLILMLMGGVISTAWLAFYKNFASFKESLKAQSFFWTSFLGSLFSLSFVIFVKYTPFFCFLLKEKIFPQLPTTIASFVLSGSAIVAWVLLIRKFFPFIPICQDKEPFWNVIKGVFKKEYVVSGMVIGLLLGLIFFGGEPLWKQEWSSRWGDGGKSRLWSDFAVAAPALGALIGFIVTWIRCHLGADSIAE
jgi:hypothetical protein